jgi:acyl carrier protein
MAAFDDIVDILADVLGEEFLVACQITPDTSFSDDLAMESIDVVELSERLQRRYGSKVNLVDFADGMDINTIMDSTVGQLVSYIEAHLADVPG